MKFKKKMENKNITFIKESLFPEVTFDKDFLNSSGSSFKSMDLNYNKQKKIIQEVNKIYEACLKENIKDVFKKDVQEIYHLILKNSDESVSRKVDEVKEIENNNDLNIERGQSLHTPTKKKEVNLNPNFYNITYENIKEQKDLSAFQSQIILKKVILEIKNRLSGIMSIKNDGFTLDLKKNSKKQFLRKDNLQYLDLYTICCQQKILERFFEVDIEEENNFLTKEMNKNIIKTVKHYSCGGSFYYLIIYNEVIIFCNKCKDVFTLNQFNENSIKLECQNCFRCFNSTARKETLEIKETLSLPEDKLQESALEFYHCNLVRKTPLECLCGNQFKMWVDSEKVICYKCMKVKDYKNGLELNCDVCHADYVGKVKLFDSDDYDVVKQVVKMNLKDKMRARPQFIKNNNYICKCEIGIRDKYYHSNSCTGVLYKGEIDSNNIIICEQCNFVTIDKWMIWTCPKCGIQFKESGVVGRKCNKKSSKNLIKIKEEENKNKIYTPVKKLDSEKKLPKERESKGNEKEITPISLPGKGKINFNLLEENLDNQKLPLMKSNTGIIQEKFTNELNSQNIFYKEVNESEIKMDSFSPTKNFKKSVTLTGNVSSRKSPLLEMKNIKSEIILEEDEFDYIYKKEKGILDTEEDVDDNDYNNVMSKQRKYLESNIEDSTNEVEIQTISPYMSRNSSKNDILLSSNLSSKANLINKFDNTPKKEEKCSSKESSIRSHSNMRNVLQKNSANNMNNYSTKYSSNNLSNDNLNHISGIAGTNIKKSLFNNPEKEENSPPRPAQNYKTNNLYYNPLNRTRSTSSANFGNNLKFDRKRTLNDMNPNRNNVSDLMEKLELPPKKNSNADVINPYKYRNSSKINEILIDNSNNQNINININIKGINNLTLNSVNNNSNYNSNDLKETYPPIEETSHTNKISINAFKILKQIGEGTFAKIYKVNEYSTGREFALKKFISHSKEELKNINLEFELLAKYKNPHILKIYGMTSCVLDNTTFALYILMENAQCDWYKEIRNRVSVSKYYKEKELLNILGQLVSGFSFLQKHNICHRDIKPQNILLYKGGVFKIADFGEAKMVQEVGKQETVRGSELYMSPILFKGLTNKQKRVNHNTYKSDVYSLGMTLILAASLSFDLLYFIRSNTDAKKLKENIESCLKNKGYSDYLISVFLVMIKQDESKRPDFLELESIIFSRK